MKRKILAVLLALFTLFLLSACGGGHEEPEPEAPPPEDSEPIQTAEPEKLEGTGEAETYPDIIELFTSVAPDSEVKVRLRDGKTLFAKITTQLPSGSAPDGWGDIMAAFGDALAAADEKKGNYGASVASAEIRAADETLIASGFNAKVQFNKFEEKKPEGEGKTNPPTISKFEYDQISVGMTLSQVREIVGSDGTLESSIGTSGVTSTIHTYKFLGEREGSYATILFDDYVVYSKHQLLLE